MDFYRILIKSLPILNDFGLDRLDVIYCRDLLEIMEDRYGSGFVLITAQLPVAQWYGVFEDTAMPTRL